MTSPVITLRTGAPANLSAAQVDTNFTNLQTRANQVKTLLQWQGVQATEVLNSGQLGIESDTGRFKVGNGTDVWQDLLYSSNDIIVQPADWTTWVVTALTDGQMADGSATFGMNAPFFRWKASASAWVPTAPLCLFQMGVQAQYTGTNTTSETLVAASEYQVPIKLQQPGGEIRVLGTASFTGLTSTKTLRVRAHNAAIVAGFGQTTTGTEVFNTNNQASHVGVSFEAMISTIALPSTHQGFNTFGADFRANVTGTAGVVSLPFNTTTTPMRIAITQQLGVTTESITIQRISYWYHPGKA